MIVSDINGLFGDALAAVEEAQAHNYDPGAAMWAAFDHLELASRDEAIMIAGLLASWIACDLNPTVRVTDLADWLGQAMALVAKRGGAGE